MKIKRRNPLKKKAKKGFRGYPVATVAYYGPDDTRASKVAVGIVNDDDEDPVDLKRWYSEESDVRLDQKINEEILSFINTYKPKSVVIADRIMGCPHEEGIDYPDGEKCPKCQHWAGRDRFTGEFIH